MTQAVIEQNVRLALGDLHVQLIIANARIAELEAHIQQLNEQRNAAASPPTVASTAASALNGADNTEDRLQ